MKDQWSGTLVMILQPGEETGEGRQGDARRRALHALSQARLRCSPSTTRVASGGRDRRHAAAMRSPMSTRVDIDVKGVGGHGAYPQTTKDPIVLACGSSWRCRPWSAARTTRCNPAVVTVGSFHAGTKHNIISDEAKLAADGAQLHARDAQAAARRHRADRPRRGDRGRACPRTGCRSSRSSSRRPTRPSTPRSFSEQSDGSCSARTSAPTGWSQPSRSWAARISAASGSPTRSKQSLIFWVGGVPKAKWDAVERRHDKLPSLHSPFWAPDAEAVISTATEAMTVAALDVLKKS